MRIISAAQSALLSHEWLRLALRGHRRARDEGSEEREEGRRGEEIRSRRSARHNSQIAIGPNPDNPTGISKKRSLKQSKALGRYEGRITNMGRGELPGCSSLG